MEQIYIQHIAFFITFVVMITCVTQQIKIGKKKKEAEDFATWEKYHKHDFIYRLCGIPSAVATGVLLTKILPFWFA